jgi:hypothetical protein
MLPPIDLECEFDLPARSTRKFVDVVLMLPHAANQTPAACPPVKGWPRKEPLIATHVKDPEQEDGGGL